MKTEYSESGEVADVETSASETGAPSFPAGVEVGTGGLVGVRTVEFTPGSGGPAVEMDDPSTNFVTPNTSGATE